MIEDELVRIWQSSPNQERIKFEKSRLMIDVQSSLDHFHKKIRHRDLMEQGAIMIVIPAFGYYAFNVPFMLTKIASVLIIVWAAYVFFRLWNAKKQKPGAFNETYMEYLYKSREYLRIQKNLLDTVLYWYILPLMVLLFLFTLGFGIEGRLSKIIQMGIGSVAVSIAVYLLNKRAVKNQIIPRLEKIDALISALEKSE